MIRRTFKPAVGLELGENPIHQRVVPVVAAEVRVAIGRLHLEDAVADFKHRDVERAAAEIIDGDFFVLLLVEPVGKRRGGGFVDDAEHFEARDLAGVLGRGALRVVEIRGHRDDRLRDFFAQLRLRVGLQLREDHRADFRRAECLRLAADLHLDVRIAVRGLHDLVGHAAQFVLHIVKLTTHESFHGEHRVRRIGDRLPLGSVPDEPLAGLGKGDNRRRRARAFGVFENHGLAAFHDGHARVGGA